MTLCVSAYYIVRTRSFGPLKRVLLNAQMRFLERANTFWLTRVRYTLHLSGTVHVHVHTHFRFRPIFAVSIQELASR